jgi:hypothetical protein
MYFNLILEEQPQVQKFQRAHIVEHDLANYNDMSRDFHYCLTFMYTYQLRNEHYVRHIVVYTKGKYGDCGSIRFVRDQASLSEVKGNIHNFSSKGYVNTGMSSFQDSRGLHYLSTFMSINRRVIGYYQRSNRLLYSIKKARAKSMVPFFLDGTYNGLPQEGPQSFTLLCFKSKQKLNAEDVSVQQYLVNRPTFSLDDVMADIDAAAEKGVPQVPVSAMVLYRENRNSTVNMKVVVLLVNPKIL